MKRPVPPRCQRGLRGLPRAACPCLSLPAPLPVPTELLSHWDGACSPGPIPQADFGMFQAASPCREPRSLCARQRCAPLLQDMIYHPNSSRPVTAALSRAGWGMAAGWHSSGMSSRVPTSSSGGPGVFYPLCWSIRAQVQVTPQEHPSNTISEASRPEQTVGEGGED